MSTSVDVIIPVYNPDNKLFQLLLRLEKQTIRPKNILIFQTVDASNEIEPIKIPENMSISLNIYYVNKNDFDHGGTRRFGASQSKADILIYMTQDAIPIDSILSKGLSAI